MPVTVYALEAVRNSDQLLKDNRDGTRDLRVRVSCSAGTYVRTLAEAVGERLGVGAHVAELRRTRAGKFRIADALSLAQLQDRTEKEPLTTLLLPPDDALGCMPFVYLSADEAQRAR